MTHCHIGKMTLLYHAISESHGCYGWNIGFGYIPLCLVPYRDDSQTNPFDFPDFVRISYCGNNTLCSLEFPMFLISDMEIWGPCASYTAPWTAQLGPKKQHYLILVVLPEAYMLPLAVARLASSGLQTFPYVRKIWKVAEIESLQKLKGGGFGTELISTNVWGWYPPWNFKR